MPVTFNPFTGNLGIAKTPQLAVSQEVGTATDLGIGASHDFTFDCGTVFSLLSITASPYSWVRVYDSPEARAADTRTSPGAPLPAAGTGFHAEAVTTTSAETIKFAPVPTCQGTNGEAFVRLVNTGVTVASYSINFAFVVVVP